MSSSVNEDSLIRAAGVALMRGEPDALETLLIHRSRRNDWSLPKGKLDPGEHVIAAAVRECDEETGLQAVLGVPLPSLRYTSMGHPKVVQYWRATALDDEGFIPNEEVDDIAWVPAHEAAAHLTYPHDSDIVARATLAPFTIPLIVLRHTQAVKRSDYKGKRDWERPLSGRGRTNAKQLVPLLEAYGVEEVRSSDALRCTQTVRKFAKHIGADIVPEPMFSEEGHAEDPGETERRIAELAFLARPLVVCSHRPVLPALLGTLREALPPDSWSDGTAEDDASWEPRMSPGAFIVIHRAFGPTGPSVVAVERHDLPVPA